MNWFHATTSTSDYSTSYSYSSSYSYSYNTSINTSATISNITSLLLKTTSDVYDVSNTTGTDSNDNSNKTDFIISTTEDGERDGSSTDDDSDSVVFTLGIIIAVSVVIGAIIIVLHVIRSRIKQIMMKL